ncbi:putative 3-hydroxyacyl-CoA dehydrogenase [Streptomyces scabiei 87.22]|uniref:Putative 3-hydroxyacyl-CoA dehydrogenase n=1 Tax=Streptomyces scabiei (strain 87.22) TaxID=680198 RepID=C9Z4T8_STRSW|nr:MULTISPECIES: 3-hydroxyacyl-CoA dehydrogenase family protein [Streptomyces]MBP5872854.1 3-hydroxyacyl-CoA dehydrogenase family protein [Streptomyces sp. LBUM 1485]MBP5911173.1 3-hydroxyacyl-CoA dehydrogenase family protein [Streptomyces sp. LBUM 1486]MDX2653275.1 3-hydroxyacyl-CoA dehydrogenase family protein [Streptomyces scabiei]MDX2723967.1 3-hydroxyacyl-CoA dehydrogenase family protein [Streptomyces scabiei]MDX2866206.1 3-hydroxyacyl-CoA dehydrogenase family protein [Streptomyces scabie
MTSAASAAPAVVGVIGGGRMGAGIAQSFAAAGSAVVIVEQDADATDAALARIAAGLRRAGAEEAVPRVTAVASVTELPRDADLVVEAVPENAALKARLLAAAERSVGEGCVLASNTSSLSVTDLAAALRHPGRFLGMHFFNPVPVSALIELVTAPDTTGDTLESAVRWTRALGKQEVVVGDSPGFASSRLGLALGLEAIRMVEEGIATPDAIDTAMSLGYKHPTGPLRLTDLVGLDVRLAIAEHLHATLGERFAPPRLLREKVARGELGRKSGLGFYAWP